MPKIQFEYNSTFANVAELAPKPASQSLPKWFKELPRFPNKKLERNANGGVSQTIKACPPFLDAMMSGYVITTEFDMLVTLNNGVHSFTWQSGGELISQHGVEQIDSSQVPFGFSEKPWKFLNFYRIKTPKGYSTLFTHPINREDLPFRTMAGVVDTDLYDLQVHFPFFLKEDFEGILPAGTPIVQLIPIKRESWVSAVIKVSEQALQKAYIKLNHKMLSAYKTMFWQRKDYK